MHENGSENDDSNNSGMEVGNRGAASDESNNSEMDVGRTRHAATGQENIRKPEVIVDYNKLMGGVDLYDQLCSYYSFDHRTVKWWKRAFFHLLNTAQVNAYILYTQSTQASRKLSHVDLRIQLARELLQKAGAVVPDAQSEPSSRCEVVPSPTRLSGRHFPEKVPPTASGRAGKLECTVCSRKRGRGKVTSTYRCEVCKKGQCIVPCFELTFRFGGSSQSPGGAQHPLFCR